MKFFFLPVRETDVTNSVAAVRFFGILPGGFDVRLYVPHSDLETVGGRICCLDEVSW